MAASKAAEGSSLVQVRILLPGPLTPDEGNTMGEWAKECGVKVGFSSLKSANLRLEEIGKQRSMHSYKCPHCRMYHLGHTKPKEEVLV